MASARHAAESFIHKASRLGAQALVGPFPFNPHKFDEAFSALHIDSINERGVHCSLTVHERLGNSYGTLHGGAIATLVDIVGNSSATNISASSTSASKEPPSPVSPVNSVILTVAAESAFRQSPSALDAPE